ncbi:MAG: 30S ribosomal protein S16 [Bdellovibrionaceae bacterium]|jgi:small subunit ribosomal protein S16|nr:30S ribosomal protein S16 [Pseudobdellovibrionaceae bacterium]
MVVIRLARFGKKRHPMYRITVADQKFAATGRYIEIVGQYNPSPSGQEKEVSLDMDRVNHWIKNGAQPTKRVKSVIKIAEKAN